MRSPPLQQDAMRIPVLAAGLMIAIVLVATATASISGIGVTRNAPVTVSDSKDIRVEFASAGTLVVTEIANPSKVHIIRASDGQGFVSVALQGLNYTRTTAGVDPSSPFRIQRDTNGRSWLVDLATQKGLALDAFGPANAAVFAQFLSVGKAQP